MISRIYIAHDRMNEGLALELARSLGRIGIESFAAMYGLCPGISRRERVSFAMRNSECLVPLLTVEGSRSESVNQEIGLAYGLNLLIIPLRETGAEMPFLIDGLNPIDFAVSRYEDAIGQLIRTVRDLSQLQWLKVACPSCGEEMTQYLTPQEEVDEALKKGGFLETVCTYCQNKISLDPRTFSPRY
ncbi:MAG: toll/interleukin-1 receptor domain-containing protein [Methanotrichaceae archaeon]|nr:toll/interleukin-1 receptor domain-containing protein [Methanotrichaceae archaeon]